MLAAGLGEKYRYRRNALSVRLPPNLAAEQSSLLAQLADLNGAWRWEAF